MGYALRRLGFYLFAAIASITLNFLLPRLMPGDPASAMFARFQGQMQPEAMVALRESFGLNETSLIAQYGAYLKHVLSGDLGLSIAYYPAPVSEVIGTGLVWTLALTGVAVVLSFALGSLLGVLAAWRRSGWIDSLLPPLFAFIGAFPYFWLAMLALFALGFELRWFPLRHAYSYDIEPAFTAAFIADAAYHAVLPATTIVLATIGGWVLGMRNNMISVMGSDYITMARAKGLTPRRVMLRYAARNALLPGVTSFGMALGFVLSGSLLSEIVFSYPGMGYLLVQAVRGQDYPLMQGLFLMITLSVLAANWLVDLAYAWLDPRTSSNE
jgi:peptide/nickel transport system permease protein